MNTSSPLHPLPDLSSLPSETAYSIGKYIFGIRNYVQELASVLKGVHVAITASATKFQNEEITPFAFGHLLAQYESSINDIHSDLLHLSSFLAQGVDLASRPEHTKTSQPDNN